MYLQTRRRGKGKGGGNEKNLIALDELKRQ